ncbi:unnamed protein product [Closterium sp. NIES-54]
MHSRLLVSGLPRSLPPLPRLLAQPCLPCVEGWQRAAPQSSSFPPTTAPLQPLHMDLRARFQQDLPVLRLHSDQGGEFCSHLLEDFSGAEGIVQSHVSAFPQENGIAACRIGLVMEVARTSMIHAAAPHFLWPFAVRYAAEQLNLWPRVSHPETSPTLQWTGEVGDALAFRVWGSLSLVRDLPAGKLSLRTLRCVFLGFPTDAPPWQFYHPGSCHVLSSRDVTFDESVCFYRLHPHRSSPVPLPPLSLVDDPPPPDTSGPAEGGDLTPAVTVTPCRSARLPVPPMFQPQPSSPLLQLVAVDSGAAGGGTTEGGGSRGAGSRGAEFPLGTGGTGAGGPATSRQEALSPKLLREWAVQWGSRGGGPSCLRAGGAGAAGAGGTGTAGAAGSGGARPGGASTGVLGTGGTGAARGAGGAGSRGASLGGAGADVSGTRGTGAARGAGGSRGASPEGASAGVPGTGGTGATGGAGGAGTARGAEGATGGTAGGARVSGACRLESLSPLQLHKWAVRWGSPGGGAGGIGSRGAVATGARGSGGATTQTQPSALSRLLCLPPAATEFLVPITTPPLLFPPLLSGSPLPVPGPHTEVTASLPARREPQTRASTTKRQEPEARASVPARVRHVRHPRAPAVPGCESTTAYAGFASLPKLYYAIASLVFIYHA